MNEDHEQDLMDTLEYLINELPENKPLLKDSGIWEIRSEDMKSIYYIQETTESFIDFVNRVVEMEND
jgi:hypothetical protein